MQALTWHVSAFECFTHHSEDKTDHRIKTTKPRWEYGLAMKQQLALSLLVSPIWDLSSKSVDVAFGPSFDPSVSDLEKLLRTQPQTQTQVHLPAAAPSQSRWSHTWPRTVGKSIGTAIIWGELRNDRLINFMLYMSPTKVIWSRKTNEDCSRMNAETGLSVV